MSVMYDRYLENHKANVGKAFEWMRNNIPEVIGQDEEEIEWQIYIKHDSSKTDPEEYDAYDAYFYGDNRSYSTVREFNKAWLHHIHMNPHHWQHWVLINDDPGEGEIILDMPCLYIIEMICDWWSFSWSNGDLTEIFNWYSKHKDYMKLSDETRKSVEYILGKIEEKLKENSNG